MIMKKKLFFAAVALVALASCSSEEIIGDSPTPNPEKASDAIVFNSGAFKITRGADLVGSAAAEKLQNQFVVYGIKHATDEAETAANDEVVFQNYVVNYFANTAGTTASNSQNWEYVGQTPYASTTISPAITGSQAIKYWDYSAAQGYTFYAIASKADMSATTPLVTVTKTTTGSTVYDKGYSVVIKNGANLDNLYVSDRTPVIKNDYGKPVLLKFRNFGARVRVGFYETIPGYSVKINNFYVDGDASAAVTTFTAMDTKNASNFAASLQNIDKTAASNTLAVTYYDDDVTATENHDKLTPSTATYNYSLVLGTGVLNTTLAETSATPTWDQTSGAYTTVIPFETNSNPMLVKVDYTLTALDGSNETIEVKGANVVVPTQYVQWKSNFAYTYIFKISDESNGDTGTPDTDPQGLFPITFDAAVVAIADANTQETITEFGDYAITTYANGSEVTVNNEYKVGEDIYVVKTDKSTPPAVVAPSAIGTATGNAQVYTATTTSTLEGISEATVLANLLGSPNGITLTATSSGAAASLQQYAPANDGTQYDFGSNGAVKFTPSAAGTYVYVFTRTAYVAPTYTAVGSGTFDGSTTYYFKTTSNVYYAAPGINADNFEANKANLFTQTDTGTAGAYDIKVIKVQ